MHPHANGKDAIFTPYSWGRNPNPGKQGLIDEAMTAISEVTRYLDRLGTVQSELYMLLTDLERREWTAEALWIEDNRCWMEVTPLAGWGGHGPERRWEYKSIIAHEIAHCFFMENFEGYNDNSTNFDAWWDETDNAQFDACLVGNWEMDPPSRSLMFGEDGPVGGRVGLAFGPSGAFVYTFSNLTFHGVSYTKSGKLNMEILKTHEGTVRGCATTMPQGQRLDGAIPMKTHVVADGVRRSTMIRHGGVGTTTAKAEDGLEAWFWPHKPTYYHCEGDTLHLERRVFQRATD